MSIVVAAGASRPSRLVKPPQNAMIMVVAAGALRPARLVKP
jgi:hypothetical protein